MKLRCPRCQAKITVKDEWAGKAIRCTACNKAFQIPKPQESTGPLPGEDALDLESLAKLEARAGGMADEELAAAQAAVTAEDESNESGAVVRTCPHCQKEVNVKDPYVDLLCSHCWKPIPALKRGAGVVTGRASLVTSGTKREAKVGFYEGLGGATAYPFGAVGSLLLAVGVAIGAILLPTALMTALARTSEQSDVGSAQGVTVHELTGLEKAMSALFFAEVLFFIGVGVHAFIDVARTTSIGEEQPPPLVWNPASWGESLVGYLALVGYYAVFALVAILIANGGSFVVPSSMDAVKEMLRSATVLTLAGLMTFFVPMNLLGLTVGKVGQALHPVRIVKSILATHANYIFLFLLVTVYMALFVGLFVMVLEWFGGQFRQLQRDTSLGNVTGVAGGLVSWGLVMGVGFYGVYVLGRLHGLFARTFRKQLEFTE